MAEQKYELGALLGKGEFGEVHAGTNRHTGRRVAVKLSTGETGALMLKHEGRMHAVLTGVAGIPQLKDCGAWHDRYYIALPLLGRTWKEAGPECSRHASCAIAARVLDALAHMHGRGLVHRDITPSNIMLGQGDNGVWLCDLGLARPFIEEGRHLPLSGGHALVGTETYASHNVRKGLRASRRDDLESLGATLWSITTPDSFGSWQAGAQSPDALAAYGPGAALVAYARTLDYAERPRYQNQKTILLAARNA